MNDYYNYGSLTNETVFEMNPQILWATAIISLVSVILGLIIMFKIFKKLGIKPWKALIPIYNMLALVKSVNLSGIYVLLLFIPIANIYALIKIWINILRKLGKKDIFILGILFLPLIFLPILAFSKSKNNEEKTTVETDKNTKEELIEQKEETAIPSNSEMDNTPNEWSLSSDVNESAELQDQHARLNQAYDVPELNNEPINVEPINFVKNSEEVNNEQPVFENNLDKIESDKQVIENNVELESSSNVDNKSENIFSDFNVIEKNNKSESGEEIEVLDI